MNAFTVDNARRLHLNTAELLCGNRSLPVDRVSKGIHNAPKHGLADRDLGYPAGPLDQIALLDPLYAAHNGHTDVILLKIERKAHNPAWKLQQLHRHAISDPVNTRDVVAHRQDRARLRKINRLFVALDLLLYDVTDFFCSYLCHYPRSPLSIDSLKPCS